MKRTLSKLLYILLLIVGISFAGCASKEPMPSLECRLVMIDDNHDPRVPKEQNTMPRKIILVYYIKNTLDEPVFVPVANRLDSTFSSSFKVYVNNEYCPDLMDVMVSYSQDYKNGVIQPNGYIRPNIIINYWGLDSAKIDQYTPLDSILKLIKVKYEPVSDDSNIFENTPTQYSLSIKKDEKVGLIYGSVPVSLYPDSIYPAIEYFPFYFY